MDGPRTPYKAMVTGLYPSSNLWCPHHTAGGHKPYRGGVPTVGETSHTWLVPSLGRAWASLPSLTQTLMLEGNPSKGRSPSLPRFSQRSGTRAGLTA